MKKMLSQFPAAQLRKYSHFYAKTDVETDWSSTYSMLERYGTLRGSTEKYINDDVVYLLLVAEENSTVDYMRNLIRDLDSITKNI